MQFLSAVRTVRLTVTALGSVALVAGCGGGSGSLPIPSGAPVVLAPACGDPAPLSGDYVPGSRTYVLLLTYESTVEQARLLEARYGFTLKYIYNSAPTFVIEAAPEALARLRCDPLVANIAYDDPAYHGGGSF
jgi:hypothetical protein